MEPPRVRFPRGERVGGARRPHLREHRLDPRVREGRRTTGVRVGARDGTQDRAARRGARVDRDVENDGRRRRVGAGGDVRCGFLGRRGDGVGDGGRGGCGGAGGESAVQQDDGVRSGRDRHAVAHRRLLRSRRGAEDDVHVGGVCRRATAAGGAGVELDARRIVQRRSTAFNIVQRRRRTRTQGDGAVPEHAPAQRGTDSGHARAHHAAAIRIGVKL